MSIKKSLRYTCMTSFTVLLGLSLVGCNSESKTDTKVEKKVETSMNKDKKETKEKKEQSVFFKEKSLVVDYSKSPEEILANYTEKGMNAFKVNFPDTLSMNYALENVGKKAPNIAGKTMDNKEISLDKLKGKKVIVSFTKTTCSICKEMSPIIQKLSEENKDIVFLNVFPVDTNKDVNDYYKALKSKHSPNTLTLGDNKNLKNLAVKDYNITQVPTFIFIDETGKISYTYIGNKDKTLFKDMIDTAFGSEKLYDNLRKVTVRVDKDGKEIVEEKLIDQNIINEDSVDHTKSDTKEDKKATKDKTKKSESKKEVKKENK